MEREPSSDLAHPGDLGIESIDEDVIDPDERLTGVYSEPDHKIKVTPPGTVAMAADPASQQAQRTGLFDLEGYRGVGRGIEAGAVLGRDPEREAAFAHQLTGAPDPGERPAPGAVEFQLDRTVIDH